MILRKLIVLPFLMLATTTQAQTSKPLILNFLKTLQNPQPPLSSIKTTYLCTDTEKIPPGTEGFTALNDQLQALRDSLQAKDLADFTILRYNQLPETEQDIRFTNKAQEQYIYRVKYKQQAFLSVLVKDDRIYSFTTLNKGGTRIFILYCAFEP